jgi:hypothetical protein
LSVIAVGSTVLACVVAAYTSCIIMQNVVAAPVAYFVCEPDTPVVYYTSTYSSGIGYSGGSGYTGGSYNAGMGYSSGVSGSTYTAGMGGRV